MAWYRDWFGRPEYELVYQERDEEEAEHLISLIEQVARPEPGAHILDMGCGRGRHARSLARRGYRVTGVDLSEPSIREARERAREEGLDDLTFEVGDMREAVCEACFDGVANLFTAFGYFEEEEDHLQALEAMTAALRPGGWFFQDFMNAPYVRSRLVAEDTQRRDGLVIHQKRWIDDGRVNKEITIDDGHRFVESVRLLTLEDFERLYQDAGLELLGVFGDYDGAPHGDTSPRLILYARRAEG